MSTRASIWYHPPFHIFEEMLDNVIYVEVGCGYENRIPLWITRRWLASRSWSGTFFCRFGWHVWWLNSFAGRGAPEWKCLKCGRITS